MEQSTSCVDIVGIDDVESRELSQNSYTLYMYNYTLYFCDSVGSEKKPGFLSRVFFFGGGGENPREANLVLELEWQFLGVGSNFFREGDPLATPLFRLKNSELYMSHQYHKNTTEFNDK